MAADLRTHRVFTRLIHSPGTNQRLRTTSSSSLLTHIISTITVMIHWLGDSFFLTQHWIPTDPTLHCNHSNTHSHYLTCHQLRSLATISLPVRKSPDPYQVMQHWFSSADSRIISRVINACLAPDWAIERCAKSMSQCWELNIVEQRQLCWWETETVSNDVFQ